MKKTTHSTPNTIHYSPFTTHFIFVGLFLAAFLERIVFDLGPNIELITAAMVISAYYLGRRHTLWLILSVMVITDLIIGNSNIFLFTWSGFLIPALFISLILRSKLNLFKRVTLGTVTGLISNLFFFAWTNFGVWFLGTMYTKDLSGLMLSYINAIPFLRLQLISTLIFVPLGFMLIEIAKTLGKKINIKEKFSQPAPLPTR